MTKQQTCAELIRAKWASTLADLDAIMASDDPLAQFSEYHFALDTYVDDDDGTYYVEALLSGGGPSDMLRFHHDSDGDYRWAEYRYHDWFDGAGMDVSSHDSVRELVSMFQDLDAFNPPAPE